MSWLALRNVGEIDFLAHPHDDCVRQNAAREFVPRFALLVENEVDLFARALLLRFGLLAQLLRTLRGDPLHHLGGAKFIECQTKYTTLPCITNLETITRQAGIDLRGCSRNQSEER